MIEEVLKQHYIDIVNSITAIIFSYLIFSFLIYPLYFHPLSKIPGPKICALTKYWILYLNYSEKRNRYVHKLHSIYGPIIRIGPNEVDISDVDYLKDIYINNLDKTQFYTQFTKFNSFNTFSTIDKQVHRESRKVSNKFYSKSTVDSEPIQFKVRNVMSQTLEVLFNNQNKEINVFYFWAIMAMDGVTSFSFGKQYYDPLLKDPFGKGWSIINNFLNQSSAMFWATSVPQLYNLFFSKKLATSHNYVGDWILEQFNNSLESLDDPQADETLVTTLLGPLSKRSKKEPLFDQLRAKSEAFDHIAAGHNTTATTLSYLFYEMALHPEYQKRLQEELSQFNNGELPNASNFQSFKFSEIENLPFMNAIVNENFRIHTAIPGQEPREVGKTGLKWRGSIETPECLIPSKTTVTMQPWTLHRNPKVFPNPYEFNPDRWLTADTQQLKKMNKHMMQFGSGVRMCVGLNLAICEIKLCVCNVFARYNVELIDGFDYASKTKMKDVYTTIPQEHTMPIIFKAFNE